MRWLHWSRRIHLYTGLCLAPWFLLYGVSSLVFSHDKWLDQLDKAKGVPNWTPLSERHYEIEIPAQGDLKPVADKIVSDLGLEGAHGAYRPNTSRVDVYVYTFWHSTQVKYFIAEKRLVVEAKRFRWDHFLTGMHAQAGYGRDTLRNLWAGVVDTVVIAMVFWVITGLLMWWRLPKTRSWGWLSLAAGLCSFLLFYWLRA